MAQSSAAADILVLMPDQQRADWLGAYGADWVRTPNVDRLAAEGVRFDCCTTPSPICMPARSSFLSGLYPHNHGQWHNYGRLRAIEETYLHPLRKAGYRTCHVGKSHLYPHQGDLRAEEPYMHSLGWDDILECTGPLATQTTTSILTDWMRREGIYQTFLDDYRKRHEIGGNKALWPSPLPDGKHADDFMARTAVEYIRQSDRSRPLFLFVGLGGPHDPWDPPERFDTYDADAMPAPLPRDAAPEWLSGPALEHHRQIMGKNPDITPEQWARIRALYSGRVEHVDACFGRVLEAWWDVRGRETWVLYWSDHGEMLGDKGRTAKGVFYRSAARVPAILRPPGGLAEGRACHDLVSLVDLTATVLAMGGCAPTRNVFGTSVLGALDGGPATDRADVISEFDGRTMHFDGRWKAVFHRDGHLLKLFDTETDPTEAVNLAGREDTRDREREIRERLLTFLLRTAYRQA